MGFNNVTINLVVCISAFCYDLFQSGKHDAIVKNVHDLLAKLAWDFSPEQLDHLFECFQVSRCVIRV